MVRDVGAVDGEMLSGEHATSFSSAKHESRLSVRKISNSAVLVYVGSIIGGNPCLKTNRCECRQTRHGHFQNFVPVRHG